ncbi:anti-sigma factor domain-containing protein [Bizionia sediminis]|uniref:Anti-sigma factor domain-containing protein n=1 Tax=Bizionia sediminis TaxID=1737064 RepID=A0ABW5KU65_9FLAO
MQTNVKKILESDLLEQYLLNQTTPEQRLYVAHCIAQYPDVAKAYNKLQNQLELVAQTQAISAPKTVLQNVNNIISQQSATAPVTKSSPYRNWLPMGIAASIIALIFAGTSLWLYNQNQALKIENQKIADEIFDRLEDLDDKKNRLNAMMAQVKQLNNPETEKYIIKGNNRAKNLKTIAYINAKEKTSMIDVVSLPKLPEEQCYQIWAELDDKMINLGILSDTHRQLKPIPYPENALALSITIEQKGNNLTATKENAVAEIYLNK